MRANPRPAARPGPPSPVPRPSGSPRSRRAKRIVRGRACWTSSVCLRLPLPSGFAFLRESRGFESGVGERLNPGAAAVHRPGRMPSRIRRAFPLESRAGDLATSPIDFTKALTLYRNTILFQHEKRHRRARPARLSRVGRFSSYDPPIPRVQRAGRTDGRSRAPAASGAAGRQGPSSGSPSHHRRAGLAPPTPPSQRGGADPPDGQAGSPSEAPKRGRPATGASRCHPQRRANPQEAFRHAPRGAPEGCSRNPARAFAHFREYRLRTRQSEEGR